ncbi:MAG: peptidylprolyl isomerase [Vicingaceae bacterium]
MKRFLSVALLAVSALTINAQENDPVLLTVGGSEVKLSEFNAIYKKNNTKESVEDYLDLYVKFKLKVKEAEDLGYDTVPKFINELKGYRKQLAEPFLTDKDVTEALIKEAYERMKYDVKASHILVQVEEDDAPADTLKAYKKIMSARKAVLSGVSFEKIAREFSEDPSVKKNGGNLGYFSAFHMVYPFETAAYITPVGKISMPIRTRFGYHLVKVEDKRKARGTIQVSHIMVKPDKKAEDPFNRTKIDEIYQKLKEGEDFANLAKQFSDDSGSSRNGGKLAPFNAGKMVASFEEASFALKNNGDYSEPVKTDFGWHIIKRESLEELGSFEDLYKSIKAKVSKDSRSNKSKVALYAKIKAENGFKENLNERNDFYKLINVQDYIDGKFSATSIKKYNKLMFGYYAKDGDKLEFTQQDFANYIENNKYRGDKKKKISIEVEVNRIYKDLVNSKGLEFKDSRLAKTNQEFRLLMQEYRDGILLFDLTDEKVWSKAVKDSAGLYNFYEKNKTKYMWGERVSATVYACNNQTIAKGVEKLLKKKEKKGLTNDTIMKIINVDSKLALKVEEGKFSKNDNEYVDMAVWEKGKTSTVEKNGLVSIVVIDDVLPSEPKALEEIKGLITSDYQNYLEKEWVKNLSSKYKVEVNQEVLKLVK